MKPAIRTAYSAELRAAIRPKAAGHLEEAFAHLERAHIIGQRYLVTHLDTHMRMLRIAWRKRDAVNLGAVIMLLRFRHSDANLRSVWLYSRNDAFGNVLVTIAAFATAATASPWPDLGVGVIMSLLFVSGSWSVYRQARAESVARV